MKNGKLRIIIGVLLLIIQLIGVMGLEETNIELWDTKDSTGSSFAPAPTELNLTMWIHGLYAGREKFDNIFIELPEALTTDGFYYHTHTTNEFLSARIRENLAVGGQFFQRTLYDLNFLIGFYLFGISGIVVLVSGFLAWRCRNSAGDAGYIDITDGKFAEKLRIPFAVILFVCLALQMPDELVFYPGDIFPLIAYGCMGVYFGFYYGKKSSVLPVAVLLITGAFLLENGLYTFFPMVTAETETQLVYYSLGFLLYTIAGILYLLCGIKLNKHGTKKKLKWLFTGAGAAELLFHVYYISQFRKFPKLMAQEVLTSLPTILFLLVMVAYIWLVQDRPGAAAVETPQAVQKTVRQVKFCRKCGTPLNARSQFCHQCGEKVWQGSGKTE